jgi:hypothetical protein
MLIFPNSDHRCNRHSEDYRPVSQPRRYLVVRFGFLNDARRVPVTVGQVYKYFPLKSSFLVAIFIFEIGSLICAVAFV